MAKVITATVYTANKHCQFLTVSGLFLAPVLLEPATYLFLAGSLLGAGVLLESDVFSLQPAISVPHDTLLST